MNPLIISPELLAMKHHFLQPLMVTAHYVDPAMQARYDLARMELAL